MKTQLNISYDKLALSCAVLIAAGLGGAIYVDAGKLDKEFQTPPLLIGDPGSPAVLREPANPGNAASLVAGPRVFTGKLLHLGPGGVVIDLSDPNSPPVHPPIPNSWWLEYGLDPGLADSPQRDPDRDGFSNLEEFRGKTNPIEATDHPPLISKLRVAGLKKETLLIGYVSDDCIANPKPGDTFGFRQEYVERPQGGQPVIRRSSRSGIVAGRGDASVFFSVGPGQLRFELHSVQRNAAGDLIATVIDRRPNKQGQRYEILKGSINAILINDYTATLYLDVPGREHQRFELEENESLTLPFDEVAAERPFRFKEVRQGGADGSELVIEYVRDGETLSELLRVP